MMGFTSFTCVKTGSRDWTTEKDEGVVLVFSHAEGFKTVSSNNSPLLSQRCLSYNSAIVSCNSVKQGSERSMCLSFMLKTS